MKYKWLLFDADGTLFDYDRAEAAALRAAFEQTGHPFEPCFAEAYRRINGRIWLELEEGKITQKRLRTRRFELLFDDLGIDADPEATSARYLERLSRDTDLIDGAEGVLERLSRRAEMALITNGLQDVQRHRFARSTIRRFFRHLVISEEVGAAKPEPKIFDEAFRRMGHPRRSEVLMIGDSLSSDIQGGADYGLDTCWFNPRGTPRDREIDIRYEIRSLGELPSLVEGA